MPGVLEDTWVNKEMKLTFIDCLVMYQRAKEALHILFYDIAEMPVHFCFLITNLYFKSNYFIVFEAWFLKVGLVFMVIWSFGYCFGLVIDCINKFIYAFHPGGSDGKESACSAGSSGLIPGLGRSPGEGNVYPLQYSCLENSMDRGAWQATVHGVAKSWTWLSYWHFHFFFLSCTPLCTQLSLSHLRVNSLLSWKEL